MKVTITWSACMTLTSLPELAFGDGLDERESEYKKWKWRWKSESGAKKSDNYVVGMYDIDKLPSVSHSSNQTLAPWNNHWVHCLEIDLSFIYLHLFWFIFHYSFHSFRHKWIFMLLLVKWNLMQIQKKMPQHNVLFTHFLFIQTRKIKFIHSIYKDFF